MSDLDPIDLSAKERAKAAKAARAKLAGDLEADDLKQLMGQKWGRRIVWRLLDEAGVHRLSFNTNGSVMAFQEGQRSYGQRMLALLHTHCLDRYVEMLREHSTNGRSVAGSRTNPN